MPCGPRIEYPGVIYHLMSSGDRQRDIYLDDVDRQGFLRTLAEACQKPGCQVHAYCLMRNHFHPVGRARLRLRPRRPPHSAILSKF